MQAIQTVTVGSGGAASIEFTSIPDTFTDLKVVFSIRNTSTRSTVLLTINGDSDNQTARRLDGGGSSASSSTFAEIRNDSTNETSDTFSNCEMYVANYRSSSAKAISIDIVTENNGTTAYQTIEAWKWNNTDPITSLGFERRIAGGLAEHTTATLYGILAGSDGTTTVT